MLGAAIAFALEHWHWLAPLAAAPLAAIPFAGPVLAFLAGNWKWLLPTLAAAAIGAWGGWQYVGKLEAQTGLAKCKEEAAESIARAEKAAREFKENDYAHTVKLVTDYAGEIAELQGKYEDAQGKLARTPGVAACGNTPAVRSFLDGVRALERDATGQAGGGDAGSAGRAPSQVPTPAGQAGKVRR